MNEYKGIRIPGHCPNGCYEKRIDEIIKSHTVGGWPPRFLCGGGDLAEYRVRLFSAKLNRYTHGNTVGVAIGRMRFCPFCGAQFYKEADNG